MPVELSRIRSGVKLGPLAGAALPFPGVIKALRVAIRILARTAEQYERLAERVVGHRCVPARRGLRATLDLGPCLAVPLPQVIEQLGRAVLAAEHVTLAGGRVEGHGVEIASAGRIS